ncbi:MAG: class II aldolase/adducin family protein [bacterium]
MLDSFDEEKVRKIAAAVLTDLSSHPGAGELSSLELTIARAIAGTILRTNRESLGKRIVEVCRSLRLQGFFAGTSGNVSVRLGEGEFLITPSGVSKEHLRPNQLIRMNLEGQKIEGELAASSEYRMHRLIYRRRPDAVSVVHAHPPFCTGFASAGIPLNSAVLPEAVLILGHIPLVEYGTPSTEEVPEKLDRCLKINQAFLLANHGALTLGKNVGEAAHRMETLELLARVVFVARTLGGEKPLDNEQLKKLLALHGRS